MVDFVGSQARSMARRPISYFCIADIERRKEKEKQRERERRFVLYWKREKKVERERE